MKKRVYPLLATLALLCLLSACFPQPPSVVEEEEPPPERKRPLPKSVTLRLSDADTYDDDVIAITNRAAGESRSVNESRTLTNENAQAFHDIFEAVFYHPGSNTVARAVWNIGETPELRGVHRTSGGVSYASVSSSPPSGAGSALLFVGSNDDKTLLALGKLSAVDDVPGTTIYSNSRTVTFEVAALKAGTNFTVANSSFLTSFSNGNGDTVHESTTQILTNIYIHYKDKKLFPLYRLRRNTANEEEGSNITYGGYYFSVVVPSGTVAAERTAFTSYAAGIVCTGSQNFEVRNPRYIITDGLYQYSSIFIQDTRVVVTMLNNTGAGSFVNPVQFQFVTTDSPDGSIFALVFEIFVNNLTSLNDTSAAPMDNNYSPIRWRLSPGIGTKWLDLDDGSGGEGGAILFGSGSNTAGNSNTIVDWLNNRPFEPPPIAP